MKKLFFTIFIFLLTVFVPCNAQIFNNNETGTGENTEIQSSIKENSDEVDPGGFFRTTDSGDFTRPIVGEGIGETPIGDGLFTLMLCCMLFGSVKYIKYKQNHFDIMYN